MRAWEARSCPTALRLRSNHLGDRALAVGCSNGTVYVYDDYLNKTTWRHQAVVPRYELGPTQATPHPTGEVIWGHDAWLYASTESAIDGAHWAINVGRRNGAERLRDGAGVPITDSGDAMALTLDRAHFPLLLDDIDRKCPIQNVDWLY